MGQLKANFSLNGRLNWEVHSLKKSWLEQNIKEFKSSHSSSSPGKIDISITQKKQLEIPSDVENVSQGIDGLSDCIFIHDKYSSKKASFQMTHSGYIFFVEEGFTFYYYAALLDALIKLIAFRKGIVSLHASAIKKDNCVSIFTAGRRMGKTIMILNILNQNNDVEILADDALMMTQEGKIIPYLRGIDLFSYLPIPMSYLTYREKLKRKLARLSRKFMPLPNRITTKIINRFFLVRMNLASHGHGRSSQFESVDRTYILKKHVKSDSRMSEISENNAKKFIGESSYVEIKEYQSLFAQVCTIFPDSRFSELIISYTDFQREIDHISSNTKYEELLLAEDFSDIEKIALVI
ncbi:MAG: hypothetical protein HRT70_00530 [Flavobacteriaceae bacterium]|nr:hypothetical protein [Flavobacteriaceae bacterium]